MKILTGALLLLSMAFGQVIFTPQTPEGAEGLISTESLNQEVLMVQDTILEFRGFEALLELTTMADGGKKTPIFTNYTADFIIRGTKVRGRITLPSSVQMLRPGESKLVTVKLPNGYYLENGQTLEVFELKRKIGEARITKRLL